MNLKKTNIYNKTDFRFLLYILNDIIIYLEKKIFYILFINFLAVILFPKLFF